MVNIIPLDNVSHIDLRVDRRYSAEFGDNINQALAFPTEFSELQREYPIFFRKDAEGIFYAVVLLGLDKGENLFLQGMDWNARYVPAVQQCGPFRVGVSNHNPADVPKIQIDLDDPRVSHDSGEALFLQHGGHTPYLQHISGVLQRIHVGHNSMRKMFDELEAHNLIEPVTLQLDISETESYTVPDLFSVDEKAFSSLDSKALHNMHHSGLLALCHWVLASRGNVEHLIQLKMMR